MEDTQSITGLSVSGLRDWNASSRTGILESLKRSPRLVRIRFICEFRFEAAYLQSLRLNHRLKDLRLRPDEEGYYEVDSCIRGVIEGFFGIPKLRCKSSRVLSMYLLTTMNRFATPCCCCIGTDRTLSSIVYVFKWNIGDALMGIGKEGCNFIVTELGPAGHRRIRPTRTGIYAFPPITSGPLSLVSELLVKNVAPIVHLALFFRLSS